MYFFQLLPITLDSLFVYFPIESTQKSGILCLAVCFLDKTADYWALWTSFSHKSTLCCLYRLDKDINRATTFFNLESAILQHKKYSNRYTWISVSVFRHVAFLNKVINKYFSLVLWTYGLLTWWNFLFLIIESILSKVCVCFSSVSLSCLLNSSV